MNIVQASTLLEAGIKILWHMTKFYDNIHIPTLVNRIVDIGYLINTGRL